MFLKFITYIKLSDVYVSIREIYTFFVVSTSENSESQTSIKQVIICYP